MLPLRVAVFGSTGYVGFELVKLLSHHPNVSISYLCSSSSSGYRFSDVCVSSSLDIVLSEFEEVDFSFVDVAFLCLPHNCSHELVLRIPDFVKVIDLSADFRLHDLEVYESWYGKHNSFKFVRNFVYGLSEIYKKDIASAHCIACPGCYSTSVLLPLIPLLRSNLVRDDSIIIDSKSGASGAGKGLKLGNIFCQVNEAVTVYDISKHRHTPEIEQELSYAANKDSVVVQFTPNLIPMNRGILTNVYLTLNSNVSAIDVEEELLNFYSDSVFVTLDNSKSVTTSSVIGTNKCYIGVFAGRREGSIVITSSIDNLLKGASGQALQNFNLMFGLPEYLGLIK